MRIVKIIGLWVLDILCFLFLAIPLAITHNNSKSWPWRVEGQIIDWGLWINEREKELRERK